ncbi:MAG: hypothetical protein Q8S31_02495 [Alphaproteobacteria bacterium]|nr:hypothetical protein [Alphaproteobacteria bacterium]
MKKKMLVLISIFFINSFPLLADKEDLLNKLFERLEVSKNMRESAELTLPKTPETLKNIFGEDQEKFNIILDEERKKFLEKWVSQETENYKNIWTLIIGQNFSEKDLETLADIYAQDVFKKFITFLGKIEQSLENILQNQQTQIAITYGETLIKALEKSKEEGLDAFIIDAEIDRIKQIKSVLKQTLASIDTKSTKNNENL